MMGVQMGKIMFMLINCTGLLGLDYRLLKVIYSKVDDHFSMYYFCFFVEHPDIMQPNGTHHYYQVLRLVR